MGQNSIRKIGVEELQTMIGVDGKRRHIVRILLVSSIQPGQPLAEIEK